MSSSKRPPNELESRLHQAALSSDKKELTTKQVESIIPDQNARQSSLNFLLAVGLFKTLKDAKGNIIFRAVSKGEHVATQDLSGEEKLVFSHIKMSSNEGIWTKHLKTKTNLHQTVIDRSLKNLLQKRLIKRVNSVQHPTRKIYMLEGLEPSIALTGGPWYTDNELDTEFIQTLKDACLKFIRDSSFLKRRHDVERAIYPISNAPDYPTAQRISSSLRKANITETVLSVDHVESLLNVLVLDGKIEKIPSFGRSLWDSHALTDGESDDEDGRHSSKKRKIKSETDDKPSQRKRAKKAHSGGSDSSDSETSKKNSKGKRPRDVESGDDSELDRERRRRKKNKRKELSDMSDLSSDEASIKKKKRKKKDLSSDDSELSETSPVSRRSNHHKASKSRKRSSPPAIDMNGFDDYEMDSGGYVYRAVNEETLSVGWSDAPCSLCPSFDFCKDGGPVNPRECVYYGDWLVASSLNVCAEELM